MEGLVESHNMSLCDEQKRTEKYGYDQKHVSLWFFVEETLLFSNHWMRVLGCFMMPSDSDDNFPVIFRWRNVILASRGLHRLREGHHARAMEVALSSGAIYPGGKS